MGMAQPQSKRAKLAAVQEDPVSAALSKIACAISNAKKFHKAAALLRQLLRDGQVTEQHGRPLFEALKASMLRPEQACQPDSAKEYSLLFTAASKQAQLFSAREQAQLDVYGLWAVLRNQLATDDSFVFNKALSRIKDSISHLPEATLDDDDTLTKLQRRMDEEAAAAAAAAPAPAAAEEAVEADPFGLDAMLSKPNRKERSQTWSEAESAAMKRQALLDCIAAAKEQYHHAWACTSVDLAIENVHGQRLKFCAGHQALIDELWQFVGRQRQRRRLGPSARETKRDSHAFDSARAEWSKANISSKTAVGASGDHRNEVWLG